MMSKSKSTLPDVAVVLISVDLELNIPQRLALSERSLDLVTPTLLNLFERYDIAATWALADPAVSAATEGIMSGQPDHEIAVLGDPTWVGPTAGRQRFSRELARRYQSARAAGVSVSTLALRNIDRMCHFDLLVKHGVSIVRGSQLNGLTHSLHSGPVPMRFGVWNLAPNCVLPATRWTWRADHGLSTAQRAIRSAIRSHNTVHLMIDAAGLGETGRRGFRMVERLLRHIADRRDRRQLESATLAAMARMLTPCRTEQPTRSILRDMAA